MNFACLYTADYSYRLSVVFSTIEIKFGYDADLAAAAADRTTAAVHCNVHASATVSAPSSPN